MAFDTWLFDCSTLLGDGVKVLRSKTLISSNNGTILIVSLGIDIAKKNVSALGKKTNNVSQRNTHSSAFWLLGWKKISEMKLLKRLLLWQVDQFYAATNVCFDSVKIKKNDLK